MSEWKTLKGKEFPDGIVRYYNPHQHRWMTEEELDKHNKDVQGGEIIHWIGISIMMGLIVFTFLSGI